MTPVFSGTTSNADRSWQKLGRDNPYYGVLTDPKFLSANLNEAAREEFFSTGEKHVEHIFSMIETKVRSGFQPDRVLDFGCGAGRLVIPFAIRARTVVGVDISPGMLAEAKKNCHAAKLQNVEFLNTRDMGTLNPKSFDLVHSVIVLQHIPVTEGNKLLRALIELIAAGGIGAIHLTFSDVPSRWRRSIRTLRTRSSLINGVVNVALHKPFSWPPMEMNSYSMNYFFNTLIDCQCCNLHVEFTEHFGNRGAIVYFEKAAGPS